jgi:hypothetical protein
MRRLLNLCGFGLIVFGLVWAGVMIPYWNWFGSMCFIAPATPAAISFATILAGWLMLAAGNEKPAG